MKVTNRNAFPEALLRAVENDPYSKGDSEFSVTELLTPPRISALKRTHAAELEEDVEDRLYSLYGQIAHSILERSAHERVITEIRYFGEVSGARVSAQVDTLDIERGRLSDWKFTTAWGFKRGAGPKPEWVAQLNMQLELLRQNGLDATSLEIVGLIRDFSKMEARRNLDYPRLPVQRVSLPVWPRAKTIAYMSERIRMHRLARTTLPTCTSEDRWERPTKYAVMKRGGKRAVKLYDTEIEAQTHALSAPNLHVVFRPGESIRCSAYCAAAPFCSQHQALKTQEQDAASESQPGTDPNGSAETENEAS